MMPQTTPPPAGLCVQDLTVRYGTAAVLQGVSFSVPVSGQLIGLLGVNGSGKTTLLKAAAGLLPHTGQCLLNGVPLESLSTRRLAQTVSYIPQQSGISVSLSAREVVLMGFNPRLGVLQSPTAAMRAAADEALRTVGLADKAGQDYLTLSGGEKQLCILARTIAEDAPLLLLDEPDSALDLANRSRMTALLAQLVHTGGKTALVCLHDPALALDSCDILVVLQGVGVAAVTKEKGADVLNELVKKGELTIEQGKVLNEELKHNIKDAIRENVTIVTPPDDVISAVDSLSDEQLEALKAHIAAREATKKTAASAESNEPASGEPASGDSASDETTEN